MRIDAPIITGSFSLNGDTFNDLGAYTTTGSNTFIGDQSIVGAISASALTGSIDFTNLTGVPTLISGSEQIVGILSPLNSFTASNSNTNTFTASTAARLNSIETISASNVARLNALEIKTGSLATTGSNTFIGTQTITGSLYISSDLIVQGSSSLQNITASAVSIGTNIVNLNTANPAIRYAGLVIGDSGSIGSSGSFLYDSVQDEMIFVHRGANTTVTSSVVLMGPQTYDSIGNETYPTNNLIQKGTGNEHLVDSCIFDNGTTICAKGNFVGSGNITTNGGIIGNNSNNLYLSSNSTTGEISFWGNQLNTRLMTISGSGNVGIGTSTPKESLEIAGLFGNIRIYGRSGVSNNTISSNQYWDGSAWQHDNTSYGSAFITLSAQSAAIIFATTGNTSGDAVERMRITSTGNACFACQICAPTLEISSTNINVYPRVNRSSTSYEAGWKLATGGTDSWYTGLRSADGVGSYHFYSYTTNTSVVAITCTGNVGINTTNFGERLNIGCGGAIGFQNTSNSQKWHIVYNTNDGLNFVESAVADFRLFLKAGGNIGIGTNTPEYPLHIYRCSPLGIKVQTCGSNFGSPGINLLNGGVDTVLSATNNGLEIGTWSANDIIFKVTQVERMRINTSGIVTMPFQPSMFAQPGASMFPIGHNQTAYGWCTSGSVRYNCGFTLTSATSAACNIADAQNTGKIIIPATGKYLLQFSQRNEGQCTGDGQFFLWVNGTQRIRRHIEMWNGKPYIHVDVTAILPLNTGDCLEMGAWFNPAGKTDTFSGTGDQVNWMSLAKIS